MSSASSWETLRLLQHRTLREENLNTQELTTNIREAAIARYAGYRIRFLAAEQQWAISNPGDLDDLWADVRAGKQAVADAQGLLAVYDELRQMQSGQKTLSSTTSRPSVIASPSKEFYTRDMLGAAALIAVGYPILRVDPPEGQWRYPRFIFADDGNAMQIAKDVASRVRASRDQHVGEAA
jgi:hypothetical protein